MSWVQVNLLARGLSRGWGSICRTALSGTPFAQLSLQAPRGLHCSAVTHKDDVWVVPRPSEPQKKPIKVPAMHEDLFRPSGNGEQDKASFLNAVRSFGEHNVRKRGHVDFIYLALRKMPEFGVERDLSVYNLLLDVFPKEVFRPRNAIQRIFVHYPRQQECGVAVRVGPGPETARVPEEVRRAARVPGRGARPLGGLETPQRLERRQTRRLPHFAGAWPA